jgi:hypothetical protein
MDLFRRQSLLTAGGSVGTAAAVTGAAASPDIFDTVIYQGQDQ